MADNRPNVYVEPDGTVVYRASSVGMCVRALVAIGRDNYEEALGKDRAELLERSAREGDLHEGAVREKLVREGCVVITEQEVVNVPIINGIVVRGHTDGVLAKDGDEFLLEVKSMSNKRFARWVSKGFDEFLKYAYQISVYMKANEGRDVLYIAKRREDGFEHRQIIRHDEPPIPWKEVRKKVLVAESHRRKRSSFPACDVSNQEMWWCPFFYLHEEADVTSEETEIDEESRAVLADILPKRLELSEIEKAGKAAEEERKKLDKEIINLMGKTAQIMVEVGDQDFQISRVNSGGTKLDMPRLRADFGEELLPYENTYKFSYPKVTAKKKQVKKGTTNE